jgi:hypothetical protein
MSTFYVTNLCAVNCQSQLTCCGRFCDTPSCAVSWKYLWHKTCGNFNGAVSGLSMWSVTVVLMCKCQWTNHLAELWFKRAPSWLYELPSDTELRDMGMHGRWVTNSPQPPDSTDHKFLQHAAGSSTFVELRESNPKHQPSHHASTKPSSQFRNHANGRYQKRMTVQLYSLRWSSSIHIHSAMRCRRGWIYTSAHPRSTKNDPHLSSTQDPLLAWKTYILTGYPLRTSSVHKKVPIVATSSRDVCDLFNST